MTHRNVETLIGRLATDPALRRRFADDPAGVLREFQEGAYELTATEIAALAVTDADAIRAFRESIDSRLRRAESATEVNRGR